MYMKLKYFFLALVSAIAVLFTTSCKDDETLGGLGLISVDKTFVSIPEKGGKETVKINAVESWTIDEKSIPAGVTVTPLSGGAGETTLTFESPAAKKDIKGEIKINCAGKAQYLKFFQPGDPELKPKYDEFVAGDYWIMFKTSEKWLASQPCKAKIDEASSYAFISCVDASGSYEKGLTSTAENVFTFVAVEGGFAIKDSEGGYIYQDAAGKYNNFYRTSKLSEAMVWTVQQISDTEFEITSTQSKYIQYSEYYSTWGAYSSKQETSVLPYLVVAKDPAPEVLKLEQTEFNVDKEGGKLKVPAMINANSVNVDFSEKWLHYYGTDSEGFNFACDENTGGARTAKVAINAVLGEYQGSAEITITQAGSIVEVTVAEFLAAPVGDALYKITGRVTNRTDLEGHKFDLDTYGNFDIVDATGNAYVYGVMTPDMQAKQFGTLGVKEGDVITIIGKRAVYKDLPQVGSAYYVSHQKVTKISAADFNALDDDANTWYELTGVVTDGRAQEGHKYDLETYGNFDLIDATGDAYVYGLTPGWGGAEKVCGTIGIKEGDNITIVAHKGSYKGAPQAAKAWFAGKN